MRYVIAVLCFLIGAAAVLVLSARITPPPARLWIAFCVGWFSCLALMTVCAADTQADEDARLERYRSEVDQQRQEAERWRAEALELRRMLSDLRELSRFN